MLKKIESRFTLRNSFIVFTLCVALLPAMIITAIQHLQSRHLLEDIVASELATTTRNYSGQLSDVFHSIEHDLGFLIETPTMAGIVQSKTRPHAEVDANSATREWQDQLEKLFRSLLNEHSLYRQISLVSTVDGGRELVRVSRTQTGVDSIAVDQRMQIQDHPYLRDAKAMGPGETPTASLVSAIGQANDIGTESPAIRFVMPVFVQDEAQFGVVVLYVDLNTMLTSRLPRLPEAHSVILSTIDGDYVEYQGSHADPSLHFTSDPDWIESPFHDVLIESRLPETLESVGDSVSYFSRTDNASFYQSVFASVVLTAPRQMLLPESSTAMRSGLLISGILAMAFAALAWVLGARLVKPLADLTKLISQGSGRLEQIYLTNRRNDEIGDLTDAFATLSNRLIERSAFADAIFNGAADGIVAIDQNSEILTVNPAAAKIFGYEASAMRGKSLEMLLPAAIRHKHGTWVEDAELTENGRLMAENRHVQGLRSDGTELPLEVSISHALSDNRRSFVGIIRDVSERRQEEFQRQEMIKALERSNAELDGFAYIASHDLKAPLRVIDNASRWLEEDLEQYLNDDTRESMALLRSRIVRMERLLDDLLEHSRIGRTEHTDETVSGSELMDDVMALVSPTDGFRIEVAPEFAEIELPRMPIQSVILNLVSNAVKHHDLESGLIQVSVQDQGDFHEFSVCDDGPGIAPEFHDRVFGMFQTLRPRDEVEGSGMGLAMVKKNIELAGGTVSLKSDGDRGSTFRFTWPRYRIKASAQERAA